MSLPLVKWFTDRSVVIHSDNAINTSHELRELLDKRIHIPGIQVRPGLDRILVEAPTVLTSLKDEVTSALLAMNSAAIPDTPVSREHVIHTRYDGTDIDDVGNALGLSRDAVIMAHTRTIWRVGMLGFAPGFPYLIPNHPHPWNDLSRRESPRTKVPAGAVAVAAGMSSIYPKDLPGGWQIIGITNVALFDPSNSENPTLLAPGDLVRFEAV